MNGGLLPPKVKECGMCHEVRPLSEFDAWHVGKNKTGTRRICRACEVPANLPYPQPGKESALLSTGMAFRVDLPEWKGVDLPAPATGTDELLLLLLRRLPTGQRWTAGERGRWLRAFGGVLDFLVETEPAEA